MTLAWAVFMYGFLHPGRRTGGGIATPVCSHKSRTGASAPYDVRVDVQGSSVQVVQEKILRQHGIKWRQLRVTMVCSTL